MEIKKECDFIYYNRMNKSFKISSMFYFKNKDDLDVSKIPLLEKAKELILNERIKKSIIKFQGLYFYYFEQFEKCIFIIVKENKSIDEIKVKYLSKLLKLIEYY